MLARPAVAIVTIAILLNGSCFKSEPRYSDDAKADVTGHERISYLWKDMVPDSLLRRPIYFDEQQIPADDIDFPNHNEDEYEARVSAAPAGDLTTIDPTAFRDKWVAVAILKVFDADKATKKSKLPEGVSCIWVKSNTTSGTWQSYFAEHQDGTPCPTQLSGQLDNDRLGVAEATPADPNDIPGAVRIEPSANPDKHQIIFYIGARCGDAWCTMSLRKEQLRRKELASGTDPRDVIPGWYDIQPLAYFDKSDKEYERSDVWAKFVPLYTLGNAIPESMTGVAVARIHTSGSANPEALLQLQEHWGLNTWTPGSYIDVVLRKQKISSNPDQFKYYVRLATGSETSAEKEVKWRDDSETARVALVSNTSQLRTDYATVRLAWQTVTEGRTAAEDLWLRCDLGCCTVN